MNEQRPRSGVAGSVVGDDPSVPAPMLSRALALAAEGFYIFPVREMDKRPPLVRNPFGVATRERHRLTALWLRWPGANPAIRTGSGLLVVDVDPRSDGVLPGWLPPTRTITTPTGGTHSYFRISAPYSSRAGKLGPGVDVKADGGYVLGPGSRRPEGEYIVTDPRPLADLPMAVLREHEVELASTGGRRDTLRRFEPQENVPAGLRHDYLVAFAGWCRAQGCGVGEIEEYLLAENERACDPPVDDEQELLGIVEWAARRPL